MTIEHRKQMERQPVGFGQKKCPAPGRVRGAVEQTDGRVGFIQKAAAGWILPSSPTRSTPTPIPTPRASPPSACIRTVPSVRNSPARRTLTAMPHSFWLFFRQLPLRHIIRRPNQGTFHPGGPRLSGRCPSDRLEPLQAAPVHPLRPVVEDRNDDAGRPCPSGRRDRLFHLRVQHAGTDPLLHPGRCDRGALPGGTV